MRFTLLICSLVTKKNKQTKKRKWKCAKPLVLERKFGNSINKSARVGPLHFTNTACYKCTAIFD